MDNPPYIEFYKQFKRNFRGPLEANTTFLNLAEMEAFLSNDIRYAGQIVTCEQFDGQIFVLNNARTAWINVTGVPIDPADFGNLKSDGSIPMDTHIPTELSARFNYVISNPAEPNPNIIIDGLHTDIFTPGQLIKLTDQTGIEYFRTVESSSVYTVTKTKINYSGAAINWLLYPGYIATVDTLPSYYIPLNDQDISTKRYVDENTHEKLHAIDDVLSHSPAAIADYGKIVAANPTTGNIEFIEQLDPTNFGNLRSDGSIPMDYGTATPLSASFNITTFDTHENLFGILGDQSLIFLNGDSIQIIDANGLTHYRLITSTEYASGTNTFTIYYNGDILTNLFSPSTVVKIESIPEDYTPVLDLDIATKRYVDTAVHPRQHYITSSQDHTPARVEDYGKIVAANPVTGVIEFIDSPAAELISEVIAEVAAGNIEIADTLPIGLSFQGFVEKLLLTTYNPTFIVPTFSLTHNQASSFESGSIINVILTANFNKGAIRLSQIVGGIWTENYFVDYRAGSIIKYIINSVDTGIVNTGTVENTQIIDGTNLFTGSIQHAIGPQPLNSEGVNYDVPYPAATVTVTTSIQGKRKTFYGSNSVMPTTSAIIRALSGSSLGLANGSTFTITIGIGSLNAIFAYPSNLRAVTSVIYVEGMNTPITDLFTETVVAVEGINGFISTNYRVYTYSPINPFSQAVTFIVTI